MDTTTLNYSRTAKRILAGEYGNFEAFCGAEGLAKNAGIEYVAELVKRKLMTKDQLAVLLPLKPVPPSKVKLLKRWNNKLEVAASKKYGVMNGS